MIQHCDYLGSTLKSFRELRGGDLNGRVAVQARIECAVHLSHATRANRYEDLVSAEFCDCRERHMSDAAKFTRSGSGLRQDHGAPGNYPFDLDQVFRL
jgi:hypothetical protein